MSHYQNIEIYEPIVRLDNVGSKDLRLLRFLQLRMVWTDPSVLFFARSTSAERHSVLCSLILLCLLSTF
jgi:hypothetical protein